MIAAWQGQPLQQGIGRHPAVATWGSLRLPTVVNVRS